MINEAVYLAKRMLVDSIYRSANVEGLGTTFSDTHCILNNIKVETTYEETSFIIGMKRGWEFIFNNLGEPNNLILMESLHEVCCKSLVLNAGNIRKENVRISGSNYRPPIPNIDEIFRTLIDIDSIGDPINKALVMFCYITKLQPFVDGNKRIAQLLANKILIENNVGILSIPVDKTKIFINLLVEYYESDNALDLCKFLRKYCIEYSNQ